MDSAKKRDYLLITLLGIAHGLSHFFHLVIPSLIPWILPEFDLSYAQIGFVATVFFVVSAVGQAASGFVVDSWGAKKSLFLGTACLAAGGFALAVAPNYWTLVAASAFAGMGNCVFHPVDYTIMNRAVSKGRLAYAFSIHSIVGNIGWALSPVTMIAMANIGGWRAAAFTVGVISAVVLALLMLNHRLFELPEDNKRLDAKPSQSTTLNFLVYPSIWLCFGFFFFTCFAFSILQNFSPTIYKTLYDIELEMATFSLTSYLTLSAIGVLAGGWVAKRFENANFVVAVVMTGSALMAVLLAMQIFPGSFVPVLMGLMGLGVGVASPSRDMMIRQACLTHMGEKSFGRVYGFTYSGMDVGQMSSPLVVGPLLDMGQFGMALWLVAIMQTIAILTALRVSNR